MLSTSACQLASMTLCDTPTVPQRSCSSPDSIRTRTVAAGALRAAEHADLVVVQLARTRSPGRTAPAPCAARSRARSPGRCPARRCARPLPSGPSSMIVASAMRRLASCRFSSMTRNPIRRKKRCSVAVERLAHQQLERRLRALVMRSPATRAASARRAAAAPPGSSLSRSMPNCVALASEVGAAREIRDQHALRVADERGVDVLVGLGVLLHRRDVQAALVREGALADVRLGACSARGWRARRPGATRSRSCAELLRR